MMVYSYPYLTLSLDQTSSTESSYFENSQSVDADIAVLHSPGDIDIQRNEEIDDDTRPFTYTTLDDFSSPENLYLRREPSSSDLTKFDLLFPLLKKEYDAAAEVIPHACLNLPRFSYDSLLSNHPTVLSTTNDVAITPQSVETLRGVSPILQNLPLLDQDRGNMINFQIVTLDLDRFTRGWNTEETRVGRRLVQFTRYRVGIDGLALRGDIVPQERFNSKVEGTLKLTISCIRDPRTQQFFYTSVDVLRLVEFTVNGIDDGKSYRVQAKLRRLIDEFREDTIWGEGMNLDLECDKEKKKKKKKPPRQKYERNRKDIEELYRSIESFEDPEPKKIRCKVKIFDWETLKQVIEKCLTTFIFKKSFDKTKLKDIMVIDDMSIIAN